MLRPIAILVLGVSLSLNAVAASKDLAPPPTGATLPVSISRTLKPQKLHPGDAITAELIQNVPVNDRTVLPKGAKLDGRIVNVSTSSVGILFNQLRWKEKTLPVRVRLLAAASPNDVFQTRLPLGATDRSTSDPGDWTTRQIGGDEVYLSAGAGKVYDEYSQPVGFADFSGVYANPSIPRGLPRAVGPFSTTATGLHGFREFSIVSAGDSTMPITLAASKPDWQIGSGSALLLEVVR